LIRRAPGLSSKVQISSTRLWDEDWVELIFQLDDGFFEVVGVVLAGQENTFAGLVIRRAPGLSSKVQISSTRLWQASERPSKIWACLWSIPRMKTGLSLFFSSTTASSRSLASFLPVKKTRCPDQLDAALAGFRKTLKDMGMSVDPHKPGKRVFLVVYASVFGIQYTQDEDWVELIFQLDDGFFEVVGVSSRVQISSTRLWQASERPSKIWACLWTLTSPATQDEDWVELIFQLDDGFFEVVGVVLAGQDNTFAGSKIWACLWTLTSPANVLS
jgi:hypothetical protein